MERVRSRRAARHLAAADRAGALAAVHHTEAVSAGAAIAAAVHVAVEIVLKWAFRCASAGQLAVGMPD